jgi:hypothetical protein
MPDADWRPIETAPKDQDILVFSLRWGALIAAFSSEFGQWLPRMQCPVALHAESDGVTHWMPLPIAPAFRRGGQLRGPKLSAKADNTFGLVA